MNNDDHLTGGRTSRRTLIKAGAAATGAAYVAPQILRTAVAGAQTTTCYVFKLNGDGGACQVVNPGPPINDPSCDGPFNTALANAAGSGMIVTDCAAGNALITITSGLPSGKSKSATITITEDGCTFAFAGYKAGQDCFTDADATVQISGGGKVATFTSVKNISHLTLVVCCTGSP